MAGWSTSPTCRRTTTSRSTSLTADTGALPDGLDGAGICVQGHNRSDDLFMYLKRRVDGLTPAASYSVSATVDLATNAALASVGIGGSPGSSVFVKAGASTAEPEAAPDSTGHLRMNIDKGNQSRGGSQMAVLGTVGHPDIVGDEYRLKTLDSMDSPVVVKADDSGNAWLIVGTDSGFEGLTRLYYDRISFTLTPTRAVLTVAKGRPTEFGTQENECPRQESNLRTRFRRPMLYPLSYEGGVSAESCAKCPARPRS